VRLGVSKVKPEYGLNSENASFPEGEVGLMLRVADMLAMLAYQKSSIARLMHDSIYY